MRAAAITILLRAAAACVFCPHDVTLDEEIDFENICAETSMPANCFAGWLINSDADATTKAALGCSVVGGSVTIQTGSLTATGLAQLSGLTARLRLARHPAVELGVAGRPRKSRVRER